MDCALVTLEAGSTQEAAAMMRELGYRKTDDLRWKVVGMTVDDLVAYGLKPSLARFKRSGRVLANAYYWSPEQEREIAACSIRWLEEQIERFRPHIPKTEGGIPNANPTLVPATDAAPCEL